MTQEVGSAGVRVAGEAEGPRPERPGWLQRFRIPLAIAVLVGWVLVTALTPSRASRSGNFIEALMAGPQWGFLAAGIFLAVVAVAVRWGDLGFNLPTPAGSLKLLWLPGLYLVVFALADIGAVVAFGPPPVSVVGFLLLNTVLVGFSEETMFRGVLFSALLTRLRPGLAISVTTLLFGLAHLLNAAAVGSWRIAAAQAVAAAMSGLVFIAMRVRTGSLLPAIVYHAAWDFGSLLAISRVLSGGGPAMGGDEFGVLATGGEPLVALVAPVLLLLPNFLYALFLLRRREPLPAGG